MRFDRSISHQFRTRGVNHDTLDNEKLIKASVELKSFLFVFDATRKMSETFFLLSCVFSSVALNTAAGLNKFSTVLNSMKFFEPFPGATARHDDITCNEQLNSFQTALSARENWALQSEFHSIQKRRQITQ